MADILLSTLNAKYIHTSFGLRYLYANLGPLQARAEIVEFTIDQRPLDIAEALLTKRPSVIGLGVYIWNVTQTAALVALLKRLAPEVKIVLGGPEVSFESDDIPMVNAADVLIKGEADIAFRDTCELLLEGSAPPERIITPPLPSFDALALPYDAYTDEDIANRLIYVEASRGCPFRCEFCLSSLDVPVRKPALDRFLAAMDRLIARGVQHFKFVDRTFNLNLKVSEAILGFFASRVTPDMLLHFEMIPDRLPERLKELIAAFPPTTLQFEVGIQTFDPDVAARIQRRQDPDKVEANLRFLRATEAVHIHADLIVGLPGEDVACFARGFDRLVGLAPQEIQVGILKRLKGTPIARHDETYEMVYGPEPPYEILRNGAIDFETMQRLRRFARIWDLVANSGNFVETHRLIWGDGSPFEGFMAFSDHIFASERRTHAIALTRLTRLVFDYLVESLGRSPESVAPTETVS